jgi:ubiquinone/menaquinone biosynthesis C-methylase UbiE
MTHLFLILMKMLPGTQKAFWKWWYQRLAKSGHEDEWSFMNYGFQDADTGKNTVIEEKDEANRLFIQLYDTAAASVSITGLKALEIGSGRGGGAAFVNKYYKPETMLGLDYSQYAVDLATNMHKDEKTLTFIQGDAEKLDFANETFDVIINVESSHCYGTPELFFEEVMRVLKPGGWFSWVDFRPKDKVSELEKMIDLPGWECKMSKVITKDVVRALDIIHDRKMKMISQHVPGLLRGSFREFSGVKGSKIYKAFSKNEIVYMAKTFQKKI